MERKPHVVVIMADQLRFDVLGRGFTPNIDSLGQDGVTFARAYTASPLCVPARGAFFTGICPNRNGSLINPWEPEDARFGDVRAGIDNLYTLMESGWDSIHSGKQHLYTAGGNLEDRADSKTRWVSTETSYQAFLQEHGKAMPGGPSFRARVPEMVGGRVSRVSRYSNAGTGCYEAGEEFYFDTYFAERAVAGIRERDRSRPLLLNAMFLAPHPPLQIPEPWYGRVSAADFELPENVGIFYPHQSPLQMYNLTGVIGSRYTREDWAEPWRVYLGLVGMLDHCVGQILAELKQQGIYDDSLILFTSDHGEMLGSHGLFQKMCMYEESVRVPLIFKFPGEPVGGYAVTAGTVCEQTVSHLDVMPTLCDYLGLKTGNRPDGTSLMPLMSAGKGEGADENREIFIQYDGNGSRSNFQRCVMKGDFKLIVDLFKDEVFYELYDIRNDGQETVNLLFQEGYDVMAADLAEALAVHLAESGDLLTLPVFDAAVFRERYGLFPA